MISQLEGVTPLKHGGDLQQAVDKYALPLDRWIDMSTGISPWAYPVRGLSDEVWHSLPPKDDALLEVASQYYGCSASNIVTTPGSQICIRLLPQCLDRATVAIPRIGYQEHARSWQLAGHEIYYYSDVDQLFELVTSRQVKHAVMINPNNPNGERASIAFIERLIEQLSGTLVVDEAFIDPFCLAKDNQTESVIKSAAELCSPKLLVLRSVGKFFGLAGIRIGFVIGSNPIVETLKTLLHPWSVSYASQVIAQRALSDQEWQQKQVVRIKEAQACFKPVLAKICQPIDDVEIKHSLLFNTVFGDVSQLTKLHHELALKGIWTRLCNEGDDPAWLRFSLPRDIEDFVRRLEGK